MTITTTTFDPAAVPRLRVSRDVQVDPAELRADEEGSDGRTLVGHFAVFDRLTEIHSFWEGDFREQISKGAFARTVADRRDQIRCIYAHGRDSTFGSKPIGTPRVIEEDDLGARYEVPLYANQAIDDWIVPAARDGQLGASFAFDVIEERWDLEPDDGGLPIRTIEELRLYEFGPCPFPAYNDATAGVRSVVESWQDLPADRREILSTYLASDTSTTSPRTGDAAGDRDPGSSDDLRDPSHDRDRRERDLRLRGLLLPERDQK